MEVVWLVFNLKFELLISAKNMLVKSYDVFKLVFFLNFT